MKGDRLDDAIDAGVRDIMRAEPPAGIRQRVLRRIAEGERRGGPAALRVAFAAAVVLCVAVGGLIVSRREPVAPPSVSRAAPADLPLGRVVGNRPEAPPPSAPPAVVAPAGPSRPRLAAPSRGGGDGGERTVSVASVPAPADSVVIRIRPLAPLAPIDVEPLDEGAPEMSEITIAPIQLEPVRVDALPSMPR